MGLFKRPIKSAAAAVESAGWRITNLLRGWTEQGYVDVDLKGTVDITDNPTAEKLGLDKIRIAGEVRIQLPEVR